MLHYWIYTYHLEKCQGVVYGSFSLPGGRGRVVRCGGLVIVSWGKWKLKTLFIFSVWEKKILQRSRIQLQEWKLGLWVIFRHLFLKILLVILERKVMKIKNIPLSEKHFFSVFSPYNKKEKRENYLINKFVNRQFTNPSKFRAFQRQYCWEMICLCLHACRHVY